MFLTRSASTLPIRFNRPSLCARNQFPLSFGPPLMGQPAYDLEAVAAVDGAHIFNRLAAFQITSTRKVKDWAARADLEQAGIVAARQSRLDDLVGSVQLDSVTLRKGLASRDRKSTRLNSSHVAIS